MRKLLSVALGLATMFIFTCCGDEPEVESAPIFKSAKQPDTKGLPPSTDFYAALALPTESDQKAAFDAMLDEIRKGAGSNPRGREFLRGLEDIVGRLTDAGLGDFTRGDIQSVVIGATLPARVSGLQNASSEEMDLTVIIRGRFNSQRTKSYCEAEKVRGTLVDGQQAWELNSFISKLGSGNKLGQPNKDKDGWLSFADESTIIIGSRNALRRALIAYKGQSPSLKPARIKAAEEFSSWNLYVCFANPRLIEESVRDGSPAAVKLMNAMPHDQVLLISGLKGDEAVATIIMANQTTQENIQYSASMTKSLLPKMLEAYFELFSETIGGR
jgi:hypothetical protein